MDVKYCHECGAACTQGMRFCQKCGKPIQNKNKGMNWPALIAVILAVNLVSNAIFYFAFVKPHNDTATLKADAAVTSSAKPKTDDDIKYETKVKETLDMITASGNAAEDALEELCAHDLEGQNKLKNYMYSMEFVNAQDSIAATKESIRVNVNSLNNPPERYKELFQSLFVLYSDYAVLCSYVTTPPKDLSLIKGEIYPKSDAIRKEALRLSTLLAQIK